jgi:hypothetical protein
VQNPGITLAHSPMGRLPRWSGQYLVQSGGVDACGEVKKSLGQLVGAKQTLGPQVPAQAVYLGATRARSGTTTAALTGARSYEIRFPAGDLPPHGADGFWSIALYNAAGYLVANPINRYAIGNGTHGLVEGPGGSLTIVLSASRPGETAVNWLPGSERCLQRRAAPV